MNTTNAQLQASFKATRKEQGPLPLPRYHLILLAVDSSDHSNRSLQDAVQLAGLWNADITGAHVYAAKLHDVRFRQMEGGLPEQFREEDELERQRDVHDDLIHPRPVHHHRFLPGPFRTSLSGGRPELQALQPSL